jgi:peptidoglycan/xylan/chitin deacetylase (PgdA/CDA1 family)
MIDMTDHKLSVTVDLEDWYHTPLVCGPSSPYKDVGEFIEKWKGRYDYLSDPTKRVLSLLDEFNINATFYVVADLVENYPGLVESIAERGHEIACHGLHHYSKIHPVTKNASTSVEEFKRITSEAKMMLEKVWRHEVVGYRAPNAYVAGWMLDALEDLGFRYDSSVSVNSLYNKTDSSLKGVCTYPYYPKRGSLLPGEKRDFVEFPYAYYDILGFRIPTSGGPMLRFLGEQVMLKGLRQSLERGHTMFYFHPIDISSEKFPYFGKLGQLYWIVKGKAVERRIRHIFAQLDDVEKVPLRGAALDF